MFQTTTKVVNGTRDDVRNRTSSDNANEDGAYSGLAGERMPLTEEPVADLPMEAIGVDEGVTHNYVMCASEKKIFYIVVGAVLLTVLTYISKQGLALYLSALLSWVQSIGIWGNAMFVVLFVLVGDTVDKTRTAHAHAFCLD